MPLQVSTNGINFTDQVFIQSNTVTEYKVSPSTKKMVLSQITWSLTLDMGNCITVTYTGCLVAVAQSVLMPTALVIVWEYGKCLI